MKLKRETPYNEDLPVIGLDYLLYHYTIILQSQIALIHEKFNVLLIAYILQLKNFPKRFKILARLDTIKKNGQG
jgi:hypothetical protein